MYFTQLVRLARICNQTDKFVTNVRLLTQVMKSNAYNYSQMVITFYQFASKYKALLLKFGLNEKRKVVEIAKQIFM